MGMWTTENQDTFYDVLKAFGEAARKNYGPGYAFEAGYLQSLAVQMIADMPKRKQKALIADMIRATQKQEQQYIKKLEENQTMERV